MKFRQRCKSRLATAATVEFPDSWMPFQFLRAILAVPRMPQRILRSLMSRPFDPTSEAEGRAKLCNQDEINSEAAAGDSSGVATRRFERVLSQTWSDSR